MQDNLLTKLSKQRKFLRGIGDGKEIPWSPETLFVSEMGRHWA